MIRFTPERIAELREMYTRHVTYPEHVLDLQEKYVTALDEIEKLRTALESIKRLSVRHATLLVAVNIAFEALK